METNGSWNLLDQVLKNCQKGPFGDGSLPALHCFYGHGCSMGTLTPVSAERTHSHVANVPAASGSTWPPCQCVRPLLIRKSCSFCRHVHCLSWHHSLAKALQKMETNGGMYPLCCQNDILVSHCSFADFFLEWLQMLKNNEMLSLGRQNGRQ